MPSDNKKLQHEHAADDIRTDDLVKATQREAKAGRDHLRDIPVNNRNYWRFHGEKARRRPLPRGIKWGIAGLIVLFVVGFAVSYYLVKREVAAAISLRIVTLQTGVTDLQNLNPQSAAQEFSTLNASPSPSGIFGSLVSLFEGSSGAVRSFSDLSGQLTALSRKYDGPGERCVRICLAEREQYVCCRSCGNTRDTLAAIDADSKSAFRRGSHTLAPHRQG